MTLPAAFILLAALLPQDPPPADRVELINGDRITGRIKSAAGGMLVVDADYGKELKLDMAAVRSLATSGEVVLQLESGDRLKGRVAKSPEGRVTVALDGDQTAEVDWSRVAAINPPETPPALLTGSLGLGASLQSGNTDRISVTATCDAERRTDRSRLAFKFVWTYAEDNDIRSARSVFSSLKYDYYFTPDLYAYASGEILSDEFKDLRLRTIAGLGAGWDAVKEPAYALSLEAGVSFRDDDYEQGQDDGVLSGRLAAKGSWTISEFATLSDSLVVYPNLEESGEFLLRNELKLVNALGGNWAFEAAYIVDRNSDPPPGVKETDHALLLSLRFTFGP